jgi:D-alanine-D-alanine ligase
VSPEHEVSVISAQQVIAALDRTRYDPIPLYISKDGSWLTGPDLMDLEAFKDLDGLSSRADAVRIHLDAEEGGPFWTSRKGWFGTSCAPIPIDVVLLAFHGGAGENGAVQGLLETLRIPYTGSGVFGSSGGMDKIVSKRLCREAGLPIVDFVEVAESTWIGREESTLDRIGSEVGLPAVVKPARLGSSIGISRADTRTELDAAIEEALRYDDRVLVEVAVLDVVEINCAVLGDERGARASVLEQPVRADASDLLTFEDKYQRRGSAGSKQRRPKSTAADRQGMASLDRLIPAPLDTDASRRIQDLALDVFRTLQCAGLARIDFLADGNTGDVYFNEINTIPGSFSFYLWEPAGVSFAAILDELVDIALHRFRVQSGRVHSYDVNLLSADSIAGMKASKSRGG